MFQYQFLIITFFPFFNKGGNEKHSPRVVDYDPKQTNINNLFIIEKNYCSTNVTILAGGNTYSKLLLTDAKPALCSAFFVAVVT